MLKNTFNHCPTTRYQGSKRRLMPWLFDVFSTLEFDSCLDIFGGTASVSYLLKTMEKSVAFNDYLTSSSITARAIIQNNSVRLYPNDINPLFERNIHSDIVSDVFSGIYFTDDENLQIDSLIHKMNFNKKTALSGFKKDMALHSLFQSLLMKRPFNLFHRANLNIRTNDVKRSFGNKKTWDTPIKELMEKIRLETNHAIFNNGMNHQVFNLDALEVESGFDLVYLDPPYYAHNKYSPQDYHGYYHFLEGLSNYNSWKSKIDYNKKNRPILKEDASFNTVSFIDDLTDLLSIHMESIIVMSYKSPGYPSIEELKNIIEETHKNPIVCSKNHVYSLNKNNGHYLENVIVAHPKC